MARLFHFLMVVLAVGALIANPLDPMGSSHDGTVAEHMAVAATHDLHQVPDGTHDDVPHQGILHCVTFHCATPFLAQTGSVEQRAFDPVSTHFSVSQDSILRATFLERDPPIPRVSV